MGYIDSIFQAAKRWMGGGLFPIKGATASADGTALLIAPIDAGAQAALRSSAYWACTRLISCAVGTLPTHIFEETANGKAKATSHPLYRLLTRQPNPWMTIAQYLQATVMHLLMYGNAYTLPDYVNGEVVGFWPLLPDHVVFFWRPDGTFAYRYTDRGGRVYLFEPNQIIHYRVYSLDGFVGLAPLDYHRLTVTAESIAQAYAVGIYNNGGKPSGVLEYPEPLTPEQKNNIRDSWQQMHGGAANVGRVAILDGGVKYSPVSIPLDQLQYIDSQKMTTLQVARIFGVPPHLIGAADKPTYASVEQQSLEFLRYTIQPIVIAIERSIEALLLEPPYIYRFNINGFERSDIKTRYSAYALGRQWGFLSVNDICDLEDRDRIGPAGDVYLQPLNMVPATSMEDSNVSPGTEDIPAA